MKFLRLKLVGFKSFCDQTELVTEPGLTGIVGPNGCGKSNLVEAMRWVMGESSYKAMRASGMDDVIFAGAARRPARNSAEVTLVLDNTDRTAPAALNNADILEVTRRIEREAGSVYRVNGREVRARDVQLLFADASTGAHSPALVRQGQIGELIAAKPTQRRALLEEAAGISGLHSRRHEAELRLRAAEQNLERVDDLVAQLERQLEALKRQARLAVRYRSLSGDIRRAEATLYHIRWVAARAAEKEAEAEQARLIRELADATHTERMAQQQAEAADSKLLPLREQEAAAAAALQRLTILAEQLEADRRTAERTRADLETRLKQLSTDSERDRALVSDANETLQRLAEEQTHLLAEAARDEAAITEADTNAAQAGERVDAADAAAQAAMDAAAQARAQRQQAERNAADAERHVARLREQLARMEREAARVADSKGVEAQLAEKGRALEARRTEGAETERLALAAEDASAAAQSRLDETRPRLEAAQAELTRLEAEAATLAKLLDVGTSLWPAIADELDVEPGYETALGAALGDDLEASADAGAPLHWSEALDASDDAALPQGAEPLSRYVSGSPLLKRRLDQIGLIDKVDGPGLLQALKPGQRLVTLAGDMWRWDGFIAAADAPSAAAQRLAQRNRLSELDEECARMRAERNNWRRQVDDLKATLEAARAEEKASRDRWRTAQHAIGKAQTELEAAQRAMNALESRRIAQEEARHRLSEQLAEAERSEHSARTALSEVPETEALRKTAEALRTELEELRTQAENARQTLNSRRSTAEARRNRLHQIERELEAATKRAADASAHLGTLEDRANDLRGQLTALTEAPDSFMDQRKALEEQIEQARIAHKSASDSLSHAQSQLRQTGSDLRAATDAVANTRVALGRVEERMKAAILQRQTIEKQVGEALGVSAHRTLEIAGIKPEEALPQETATAQKLERLRAERERLGGVNLSAEREVEETSERLDTMVRDRDDLIAAIAKLRHGIQTLNKEARARLSAAFEQVNGHFQDLFTTLFGGGQAELRFVDSDDPLAAGVEIFACPPGKKPQIMTLLSGGEQALTAMSLIFAVFLTNPAPICVLDEVDAPLDDANVERFCALLDSMRRRTNTRFLAVTHNPITMSRMDRLFGVTQAERGVSQLVSVDLSTAESFREAS
ncbi:chromosome partition protein Smc [Devosia pacifica]|uniref:Chromosome partition protein Smc n=1 Tax=Devosia pacifica TaxID=1335967 RepID=A0A918SBE4_9HYPH|nr:chromosome segregation protein SMC [Devosia pacifica]GHA30477.1 chromosome partition protein Smc [Devosia pacifica]